MGLADPIELRRSSSSRCFLILRMMRYEPRRTASRTKKASTVMRAMAQLGKLFPPFPFWTLPVPEGLEPPLREGPDVAVESAEACDKDERDMEAWEATDTEETEAREAVDTTDPVERVASTEFGRAVSMIQ